MTTTTTRTLSTLPAVRTARALALLQAIDEADFDSLDYDMLIRWLVKWSPNDTGWTLAQLERAVDDLADAGEVTVAPGGYQGHLAVERLRAGRMPS